MDYNVENWLTERGYKTKNNGGQLTITDGTGTAYALDTSAFTTDGGKLTGSSEAIRAALGKSGAGGPAGYTPLRNTLAGAGASIGYDATADAPIVNGQMLNKNDSRLVKVGDDYWIDKTYAQNFIPKTYENPYKEETASLLASLTDMEFSYNPENDASLKAAQQEAMLAAKQSANARGLLGGSTAEIMRQRAAQELVPQYEQMAYARYADERNAKMDTLSILGNLAENAFTEYKGQETLAQNNRRLAQDAQTAADTRAFKNREAELTQAQITQEAAAKTFAGQLDKVIAMGVVDEEAASVLGLEAGALTGNQLQFIAKLQQAAENEKRAAEADAQAKIDALEAEKREWERQKALLTLETDEKIRAAQALQ